MAGLTSTGFDAKPLTEIQQEPTDAIHAAIDPTLNLTETSVLGQYIGVVASQMRQLWEALSAIYASFDVDQAEGDALAARCRITGTDRRGATYSTATMTLNLDAGTYPAETLLVYVAGSPTETFYNIAEVVSPGGSNVGIPFRCTVSGPVNAAGGTLTSLASAPAGFNSATNPAAAVPGAYAETDAELRLRRETELRRQGSASADAIRTDVADVDGVTYVTVYENDTDTTNGDGMPPHSIEVVVVGGVAADLGAAILASKAGGIQAYGTSSVVVADAQGNSHTIGYTVPSDVDIFLDVTVTGKTGLYAGDDAVKDAITAWTDVNQGVGQDVLKARIESLVMGVAGVIDVAVEIGNTNGGEVAANYVITGRQRAIITQTPSNRIEVTSSLVNAPP